MNNEPLRQEIVTSCQNNVLIRQVLLYHKTHIYKIKKGMQKIDLRSRESSLRNQTFRCYFQKQGASSQRKKLKIILQ